MVMLAVTLAVASQDITAMPALPGIEFLPVPEYPDVGRPVTFINGSPMNLDLYFDDGQNGLFQVMANFSASQVICCTFPGIGVCTPVNWYHVVSWPHVFLHKTGG
jgi:hypothetical protein